MTEARRRRGGEGGAAADRCAFKFASPGASCFDPVIGFFEAAGERWPTCSPHTRAMGTTLLEMGFELELAGGRTFGELSTRLPKHVLEALERRRRRAL